MSLFTIICAVCVICGICGIRDFCDICAVFVLLVLFLLLVPCIDCVCAACATCALGYTLGCLRYLASIYVLGMLLMNGNQTIHTKYKLCDTVAGIIYYPLII